MSQPPIACSLTDADLAARRSNLFGRVLSLATGRTLTGDRLELRFPGSDEALELVVEVLRAERECCRFLRFEMVAEPDLGPLRLVVSGPSGTGDFLRSLLAD